MSKGLSFYVRCVNERREAVVHHIHGPPGITACVLLYVNSVWQPLELLAFFCSLSLWTEPRYQVPIGFRYSADNGAFMMVCPPAPIISAHQFDQQANPSPAHQQCVCTTAYSKGVKLIQWNHWDEMVFFFKLGRKPAASQPSMEHNLTYTACRSETPLCLSVNQCHTSTKCLTLWGPKSFLQFVFNLPKSCRVGKSFNYVRVLNIKIILCKPADHNHLIIYVLCSKNYWMKLKFLLVFIGLKYVPALTQQLWLAACSMELVMLCALRFVWLCGLCRSKYNIEMLILKHRRKLWYQCTSTVW